MATAGTMKTGSDPRTSLQESREMEHVNLHDPNVPFEGYMYYASITRAEEKVNNEAFVAATGPKTLKSIILGRFSKGENAQIVAAPASPQSEPTEKEIGFGDRETSPDLANPTVTPEEWKRASRALRTCGWGSVFYLITTDILGPFSVPWAFAQMGYGPGIALYTIFGAFACYSGYLVWDTFLHLDSDRYPLLNFGDMFYRVYGKYMRHFINVAQALQMLLMVSALILSNGQAISQVAAGKNGTGNLCFVVCLIIFMAAGMIIGQIRTLQRFGWLANFSVWCNLLIIFFVMGVSANSEPNFTAVFNSFGLEKGPIRKFAGTPPDGLATGGSGFIGSLNGLNQAVYSYGGCMFFVAFLAEMRHPWDFWKGLICANIFIYVSYMFFGLFVYSYQGQYAFNPAMQGLSSYGWQTACNVMNIVTGLIAAALYGNIGLKVVYVEVFQELLGAPKLTSRGGKLLWVATVPMYWAFGFIVAAAIPQFSYVSGLIGALFILSFTYTFPAMLAFGFRAQADAMTPDEHFDPATGVYHAIDSGMTRWIRGYKKQFWWNSFNVFYATGALATTALGCYSSVEGLITAFSGGSVATSFGCASPV